MHSPLALLRSRGSLLAGGKASRGSLLGLFLPLSPPVSILALLHVWAAYGIANQMDNKKASEAKAAYKF